MSLDVGNDGKTGFFAVFDGHGGKEVAKFVALKMVSLLVATCLAAAAAAAAAAASMGQLTVLLAASTPGTLPREGCGMLLQQHAVPAAHARPRSWCGQRAGRGTTCRRPWCR